MVRLIPDILLRSASDHGSRLAVQDPEGCANYEWISRQAMRVAAGLRAIGQKRGDRSVVVLPNGIPFVAAHFGNLCAGAISVPFDASVTPESFKRMAVNCRPRFLVTNGAGASRLLTVAREVGVERIICLDELSPEVSCDVVMGAGEFLSLAGSGVFLEGVDPGDVATLMYTTGTTGQAKGVQLTHDNVLYALRHICQFVGYSSDDREVVILPLSHNFGLGHLYCNLLNGGAVYTETGLARVGRVLEKVDSFNATGFPGTPMGFGMLMDRYASVLAKRCARLRFTVINSAPLPPERAAQLQALLPGLDIMVYFGLTEASRSTFISLTREGPEYYRSVGRALGATTVAVHDETGKPLRPGETGEIVINGPTVTPGYLDNPGETSKLLRGGWLHTGDLGHLDDRGFLFVTGRLKDVINVGGYKVNPGEVEQVLRTFPGVRDVAVVGVEGLSGATGESVVAAVVVDETTLDFVRMEIECCDRLEKFKVPARFVIVGEIPRTETGKVRRSELAKQVVVILRPTGSHA